jgi:hypothetical protein
LILINTIIIIMCVRLIVMRSTGGYRGMYCTVDILNVVYGTRAELHINNILLLLLKIILLLC